MLRGHFPILRDNTVEQELPCPTEGHRSAKEIQKSSVEMQKRGKDQFCIQTTDSSIHIQKHTHIKSIV